MKKVKINELRMKILDKKLKQVSRAKAWVFEHSEFHVLQRNVNFLSKISIRNSFIFYFFILLIFL